MLTTCTGGRPCRLVIVVKENILAGIHIYWNLRTRLLDVRCNDLGFDLMHCGGMVFCFQLPSFGRSRKSIACFMFTDISGRCLVFLPKFLMKGLVWWVLPFFLLYGVFPFGCMLIHRGRCILWQLWSLEIA